MATLTKVSPRNRMVEDLGNGNFRHTTFDAPAQEHDRLPVSFVPGSGDSVQILVENDFVSIDTSNGAIDAFLPKADGNHGLEVTVKNRKGGSAVTVLPNADTSERIDDHLSVSLPNRGDTATFVAIDDDVETGWVVKSCCTDIS